MAEKRIAPYGSWESPVKSDLIARGAIGVGMTAVAGEDVYWLEVRPAEAGRSVVVRRTPEGLTADATPQGFSARTRAHEYGGGDYAVRGGEVFFSNFEDQRLYRVAAEGGTGPRPLTPAGVDLRFADVIFDDRRRRLIAVREDHTGGGHEPVNTLVAIDTEAGDAGDAGTVLASGYDFYSSPRLSPDGRRLAWLAWRHPNMPWDGTELWVADVTEGGALAGAELVAGGADESIFQPEWSPAGVLHFVSDRSGWWNLYRAEAGRGGARRVVALCEREAEFGQPQWGFGMATYAFISEDRIVCARAERGLARLAELDAAGGSLREIETPYTDISSVRAQAGAGRVVFRAGSFTTPASIVSLDAATGAAEVLRRSNDLRIDEGYLSRGEPVEFQTEGGRTAHAFYYAPRNKDFDAPAGELPPLLVNSHGGPTASAPAALGLKIQFWTSRGFAFLDVNYGGSTGFGRDYRRRLDGAWGVVDVDDCVNAARHLVGRGAADPARCAISGGSAGGYTTLCALTFRDQFRAGASYYGVSDLAALVRDTHKFESRYLDRLVGPYPAREDLYRERSPIHHTERLACPVIFFQGLEDRVVPPNQAEMMVDALRRKGLPVAYVAFPGEQHGFRRAENIRRALDAELYFYSRVFGFEPAGEIEPVEIENL
jgi:dipeptidyl aminopeptidase/acylaminoacyl peptidase